MRGVLLAVGVSLFLICLMGSILGLIAAAVGFATSGDGFGWLSAAACLMAASAMALLFAWVIDTFDAKQPGPEA